MFDSTELTFRFLREVIATAAARPQLQSSNVRINWKT